MRIDSNYYQTNPNFGMLKKSSMNAVQHTFSEITKPQLEKPRFKEIEDLYTFSDELFANALEKTKNCGVGFQEKMAEWEKVVNDIVSKVQDGRLWRTLAYTSIQKEYHAFLPMCLENVVLNTIDRLTKTLKKNSETFNFHHEYTDDLNKEAWKKFFHTTEAPTGWIKFEPGKTKEENDKVIQDIRLASGKSHWCTKTDLFAKMCIDNGNFYVYYKDGYPTLGVRTEFPQYGYGAGHELTYEIKNYLNEPDAKKSPAMRELQELYPQVVIYEDNISML